MTPADAALPGAKAGRHFTFAELTIRNKVPGADLPRLTQQAVDQLVRLASVLDEVRDGLGRAVHITSGYRHGDPLQHGAGLAADVQVRDMSPLDLLGWLYERRDRWPLRQVIAESLHTSPASLHQPMGLGAGLWVHVALVGPGWERPPGKPWCTSVAPTSGQRAYVRWVP